MPQLTIDSLGTFDVAPGKRLINAILDAGADQHHSCGGIAKCTTCRVQFVEGEPQQMTEAEQTVLSAKDLTAQPGVRLSCQMLCDHDMKIQLLVPKPPDKSPARPKDEIEPPPVWVKK
ncbi:MAG TPA: 2Fe-2S iron-sulfur cluster-binding protein [Tepidisphaeraceae bacterium]|jgi:ferredoxin